MAAFDAGLINHLSSDHAPATRAQKANGDLWSVHFGLPGIDAVDPVVPAGVYSIPEVAGVGLTEQDARVVQLGLLSDGAASTMARAKGESLLRHDRSTLPSHRRSVLADDPSSIASSVAICR